MLRHRWVIISLLLMACAAPPLTPTRASTLPTLPRSTLLPEEAPPPGAALEFKTDFSQHAVPYAEILSGGPPKDGIPAIDAPTFIRVNEADAWLEPLEPVIFVRVGEEARAYPIQIFMWHEIVNDTVGGVPLVITFCPLCNTAIAFERTLNEQTLDFGTTGRLRYSNLIMYDRQTESWWQQATGQAIVGKMTGEQLTFYPASIIAWADFKATYPAGEVLSRDTGFNRRYGDNPYLGYDDVNNPPFFYRGPVTPDTMPPIARVLTIDHNGEAVAYPYDVLQRIGVVNDTVGGTQVVVLWAAGTASALDADSIAAGRDVGTANAYERILDNQPLTLSWENSQIVDVETNSEWNVLGQAISGPLAGQQLTPIVAVNHFWFSWAAFKPDTRIYQ